MPRPRPRFVALCALALGLVANIAAARRAPAPDVSIPVAGPLTSLYAEDPPSHAYDPLWVGMPIQAFAYPFPLGMTEHAGHLVVVGRFGSIGSQRLEHVADWDGTQFADIGFVNTLLLWCAVDWNGALVVGGTGTTQFRPAIYRRNGTVWDTLASTNGDVTALAVYNGDLVAAGKFTLIGGVAANRVARFDGTSWHAMGAGFGANNTINALLQVGSDLFAGGQLNPFVGVARWDGTSWTTAGAGLSTGFGSGNVTAFTTDGISLYAGGSFVLSGADSVPGAGRWNGTSWQRVAAGNFQNVNGLAWWNGALYGGVGDGTIQVSRVSAGHWTGTGDALIRAPNLLGVAGGRLYALGAFTPTSGSADISSAWQYDGVAWSRVGPTGAPGMNGLSYYTLDAVAANDKLYVAGLQAFSGNGATATRTSVISAWDGSSWSPLASGANGQGFCVGTFGTDVILGGTFGIAGGIQNIGRWNGGAWSGLGAGLGFLAVNDVVQHQGSLYAAGDFTLGTSKHVAYWDGSAWQSLGAGVGNTNDYVPAIASWNNQIIVSGTFTSASGTPAAHIASWDGSAWAPLGAGLDDLCDALTAFGPDLIAGGYFQHAGGQPATGVARWDGSAWHAMGTRAVAVHDFTQVDGVLYACGEFLDAGDLSHETVARWSGTDWDLMGSGVATNSSIDWIAGYHGDLYAGGQFTYAFGKVSAFITRLPNVSTLDVGGRDSAPLALAASPNPGRRSTMFSFTLPARGHVRLAVYDPAGREVALVLAGDVLAGPHDVHWNTPARPGVYFARLDVQGGERRVTRFVRLE